MKFFKGIFQLFKLFKRKKPTDKAIILDGQELVKTLDEKFVYALYVNEHGQLMYRDKCFNNEVTGVCEWPWEMKLNFQIDPTATVLDITASVK